MVAATGVVLAVESVAAAAGAGDARLAKSMAGIMQTLADKQHQDIKSLTQTVAASIGPGIVDLTLRPVLVSVQIMARSNSVGVSSITKVSEATHGAATAF